MNIKNNKGFTLVELFFALFIIACIGGGLTLFYLIVKALLKFIG